MVNRFKKISEINIEDRNSWEDNLFLTFDIDWANDKVIEYCLDIIEKANIKSTWFVTHECKILDRLRENPNIELGIHPNFNFLLNGDIKNGRNSEEIIDNILKIVPTAKSIRSHAMTQSSNLLQLFYTKGLIFDCIHFIPSQSNIELSPWKLWNNLIKIPYFWEDDLHCIYKEKPNINLLKDKKGLKVFDFHPIHVFLNTEKLSRYNKIKLNQQDFEFISKSINNKFWGSKDILNELIYL